MTDILENLYFGEVKATEKDITNDDIKRKCAKMVQVEEESKCQRKSEPRAHEFLSHV